MPKEQKEEKSGKQNKIALAIVVSGIETMVEANENAPLHTVVPKALEQTGNDTGRPPEEWELKDKDGNLLDATEKIEAFGFGEGVKLYLAPKVGAGG